MIWFAATDADFARLFRLRVEPRGLDPFTRKPLTIIGPAFDPERLNALASFEVSHLEPHAIRVLFGDDALVEVDRATSPDVSAQYAPFFAKNAACTHRLAQDAAARLAVGADGFAERLLARNLHAGGAIAMSDALRTTIEAPGDGASLEDELVHAFLALLAVAGDGSLYALELE
jgi:hypothetical protein